MGHPLRVAPVLRKYPSLRLYLENAGWPFLDEITGLMYQYPTVYVDVSTNLHIFDKRTMLMYLEQLMLRGLGKRIMFGSDQMWWPEVIGECIEVIQEADFLTREQKADIFYNNAARFLRLSEEQIAAHHRVTSE
ncbi:amidohydrolase family protein [Parahaliea maris]|uniref:Amidohydrolase family protein n=1 Tax=Parahaliea maris TaxID=2716870 RepID=A0A5C8ZX71_9GAMM|nr:amidohydrolase family protein [Parahaliea maris]TXS93048.1 amidohydrolase family protein [Parahaliea maris]